MRSQPYPPAPRQSSPAPVIQAVLALGAGFVLFLILTFAAATAYDWAYTGKIYPGISVAGANLSGLTVPQAAVLIGQNLTFPQRGQVAFQEGTNVWVATPAELGLFIDTEASAMEAYNWGRKGDPLTRLVRLFRAWNSGSSLPPVLVFDERLAHLYLTRVAAQIDKPVIEASLSVNGTDVVVQPGQVGRATDLYAALSAVEKQILTLQDGVIPLTVNETAPVILDASEQAEIARRILSAPLVLNVPNAEPGDPGPWTFEPAALAGMLSIERVNLPEGSRYQVGLNAEGLRSFLEALAPQLARQSQNPRFIFNDDSRKLEVIQPAVIGRNLDVDRTIQEINAGVAAGEHNRPLHIAYTQPQVLDSTKAEDLGIVELVASETSFYRGSAASRIQNIKTAASRFHGVLVPPGATFSMASVLGDVSLDTGYAEALIIFGDRTIQGVGGGVCQVSTTLFRTVFFGGYPIVERYPHAYRVGYYEQTSGGWDRDLAGLDATVFVPMVDFKFTNDTPHWILMETYPTSESLTWKFYSTSDGREVAWNTTGLKNMEDPPDPLYEEDPDLDEGQIKQVDWAVEGADVNISRTVYRDGGVYFEDSFATHYLPWRAVCTYGPGTDGMPPKKVDPDNPCQPSG